MHWQILGEGMVKITAPAPDVHAVAVLGYKCMHNLGSTVWEFVVYSTVCGPLQWQRAWMLCCFCSSGYLPLVTFGRAG
jgi:hypothetical protein